MDVPVYKIHTPFLSIQSDPGPTSSPRNIPHKMVFQKDWHLYTGATAKGLKIFQKRYNDKLYQIKIPCDRNFSDYSEAIYKNPVKKIVDYNRERKEQEYIPETEMQKIERQAKNNFAEQHYTYKIKEKKKLKNLLKAKDDKSSKPKTYVEQIEEQRNSVRSQILKHI